jgi:hypothetical protein
VRRDKGIVRAAEWENPKPQLPAKSTQAQKGAAASAKRERRSKRKTDIEEAARQLWQQQQISLAVMPGAGGGKFMAGTFCYPCVRAGPIRNGRGERI